MTKKQKEALAWLAGDCAEDYALDTRVWNALVAKGYATQWRGQLTATAEGRKALRALKKGK